METETHLQIAERLEYLDSVPVQALLLKTAEIGRMINGLQQALRRRLSAPPTPTDHRPLTTDH